MLAVVVHAANIQDRDGAKLLLEKIKGKCPRLKLIWADGGYAGQLVEWVKTACGWLLEIVKRKGQPPRISSLASTLGGRTYLRLARSLPSSQ